MVWLSVRLNGYYFLHFKEIFLSLVTFSKKCKGKTFVRNNKINPISIQYIYTTSKNILITYVLLNFSHNNGNIYNLLFLIDAFGWFKIMLIKTQVVSPFIHNLEANLTLFPVVEDVVCNRKHVLLAKKRLFVHEVSDIHMSIHESYASVVQLFETLAKSTSYILHGPSVQEYKYLFLFFLSKVMLLKTHQFCNKNNYSIMKNVNLINSDI